MTDHVTDISKRQTYRHSGPSSDEKLNQVVCRVSSKTKYHAKHQFTKPLSTLGKALSETITKLANDERFKCGDKVELILEIELVKSRTWSESSVRSKHSIVGVTIAQHRKQLPATGDAPPTIVPYRLLPCNSENETPSTKRKKWFERVVYNQAMRYENIGHQHGDQYTCVNYVNTKWCEANMEDEDRPRQRRLKNRGGKRDTMRFLPATEADRSEEVEQAFSELKQKVGNVMPVANTHLTRWKRGPMPALGKLVSNILVGVMGKKDSKEVKNKRGEFYRVTDRTEDRVTQILEPRKLHDTSRMELNFFNSVSDTAVATTEQQFECCSNKWAKVNTERDSSNSKIEAKHDDISGSSDQSWIIKIEKNSKKKAKDSVKNDKEKWLDGKPLKLGNELKKKIEMLIYNEMQSLALKEGMEYDISPMAETEGPQGLDDSVSEVRSFLCRVDLTEDGDGKADGAEDTVIVGSGEVNCREDDIRKSNTVKENFELTYVNPTVKSWSVESTLKDTPRTVVLSCPMMATNNAFVKKLSSEDTIWKNANYADRSESNSSQPIETLDSRTSTDAVPADCFSSIEIEVSIKDLEMILAQARRNCINDKFLINATRNRKKKRKNKSRTKDKNTSSYTDTVLSEAAKKLEHLKKKDKKQRKKV